MKQKILFVDDDEAFLYGLDRHLTDKKNVWAMTFLSNVEDALGSCLTTDYDVIFTDISMPQKTGFELLENLREIPRTKDIPVVIMTASDNVEVKKRALELGATDLLNKPISREDLLVRIQNCIRLKTYIDKFQSQNESLQEQIKERTQELEETRLQVIRRLSQAAELKDNETGMHVVRMSKYAAVLGLKAGMSRQKCNMLLNAAPMHDIGKSGIPDSVLQNIGKLSDEDREIMKTHAAIGGKILSGDNSELITTAKNIALQHHEKWDGTGYPFGLQGTDISLEGRIVAICDVFDALTSDKPYKEAWSVEKATKFIEEQKGRHFDPALVDHFLEVLPSILEIKNKYSDNAAIRRMSSV